MKTHEKIYGRKKIHNCILPLIFKCTQKEKSSGARRKEKIVTPRNNGFWVKHYEVLHAIIKLYIEHFVLEWLEKFMKKFKKEENFIKSVS